MAFVRELSAFLKHSTANQNRANIGTSATGQLRSGHPYVAVDPCLDSAVHTAWSVHLTRPTGKQLWQLELG